MNGAATQVYSPAFDRVFFTLTLEWQKRIQDSIDRLGMRLASFPHYHMQGSDAYRLRVGDYRVIYRFDRAKNLIFLGELGHRREVYRTT